MVKEVAGNACLGTKKESGADHAMDCTVRRLACLESRVEELVGRLTPVLLPPRPKGEGKDEAQRLLAPLPGAVRGLGDRLGVLSYALNDVLERLDI